MRNVTLDPTSLPVYIFLLHVVTSPASLFADYILTVFGTISPGQQVKTAILIMKVVNYSWIFLASRDQQVIVCALFLKTST